jgi:outer membrane protein OmpA-like peptidoglycan-associated protein
MAGKKIVDEAKDAASAVTKKTKDAVTKTATKGAKAAKGVAAKGADAAKGATKAAAKTATKAAAKGKDAAKGALGAAAGIIGKVKDKAADVAGDVVDGAKDIAENAGETVGKVAKGAKAAAGKAVETVKDVAEDAGETVGKVAKGAKETAENVVEGAKDLAQDAAQKVGDVAEDVGDAIKDGVEKIGGVGVAALGVGAAAVGGVAAAAGGLGKGAVELADKGLDAAHDVAEKGVDLAKDAISGVGAAASGLVDDGKKGGGFLIPLLLVIAAGGLGWYGWTKMGAKTTEAAAVSAEANMEQPAWFAGVVDGLKAKFPWLSLKLNGTSLIASGEAADKNAKDAALADLSMTLETSEGKGTLVIDDIKVAGSQETPVGAALASLGENPDAVACSKAFTDTMAGRTINFATGAAKVNDDSASLLNVLTGIATACKAHKIEVAGHTDARGNADTNLALSQARADAVKAFWVEKGVPAEGLTAKGYGATKPLDVATTEEAYAKNRRTEFIVTD